MIKIKVTKPIAIPGNGVKQRTTDLRPGIHDVDEKVLEHWFVRSLMKAGVVSIYQKSGPKQTVQRTETPELVVEAPKLSSVEALEQSVNDKQLDEKLVDQGTLYVATEEIPEEYAHQTQTIVIGVPPISDNIPKVGTVTIEERKEPVKIRTRRKRT